MGLDSVLADDCGRDSYRDYIARKVSEGTPFIVDPAVWMAFLDGLCGPRLASGIARDRVLVSFHREAVIGQRFSKNIARWQPDWRDQVVPER